MAGAICCCGDYCSKCKDIPKRDVHIVANIPDFGLVIDGVMKYALVGTQQSKSYGWTLDIQGSDTALNQTYDNRDFDHPLPGTINPGYMLPDYHQYSIGVSRLFSYRVTLGCLLTSRKDDIRNILGISIFKYTRQIKFDDLDPVLYSGKYLQDVIPNAVIIGAPVIHIENLYGANYIEYPTQYSFHLNGAVLVSDGVGGTRWDGGNVNNCNPLDATYIFDNIKLYDDRGSDGITFGTSLRSQGYLTNHLFTSPRSIPSPAPTIQVDSVDPTP